jgi:hypothetical protein
MIVQFEVSEAECSVRKLIKSGVSPIEPMYPVGLLLNAIEPIIIV